ncbi:hypothetical protein SPHG1_02 [Salmonella phage SPHG1]|nr:hypothetical protein SPHG1_02 [Salmonella phage SPHG1]
MALDDRELFERVATQAKALPRHVRRQLIIYLQDMSCAERVATQAKNCRSFQAGGCLLSGGKTPPPAVLSSGCKLFDYDVPF